MNEELDKINVSLPGKKKCLRPFTRYIVKEGCYDKKNVWFLKATKFNRGRGIYVFDTLEKMKQYMQEMSENAIPE